MQSVRNVVRPVALALGRSAPQIFTCYQRRSIAVRGPAMGMFDSIKESWNSSKSDYEGQQQEKVFKEQVAFMIKREKYTLNDYLSGLREAAASAGLNGWRQHVPGVKSNPQVQEMQQHEKIISSIPEELREDPGKIKAAQKSKIAREHGLKVEEVNYIIKRFQESKMLHGWLKKRLSMGKPLPQTMSEMTKMAMEPDSGFSKKNMMKGNMRR